MWNSIRADEFCESVRDGTHDTPKQQSFGYKLVTSKHIQDGLIQPDDAYYISEDDYKKINERSKVEKWDVLMAMIGNGLGRSAIVESNPDYAIKNIALFKMGGNEVKAKWLHYFLSTNYTQQVIINYLQGTGQPFLSLSLLRKFKVPNPPLPTQQKIASILSAYDKLIQNYKKQIEALQTAASELYKEWFVRFRFPGWQNAKFENGIPEGWKVEKLTKLVEVKYGKDHSKLDVGNIPVYGSGGIMRYCNKALYDKETVLIPRKGSLNNIMYAKNPLWTVDTMFYTVMLRKNIAKYLYYVLSKIDMESFNAGAALPSMTTEILSHFKIIVPDNEILESFDKKIALIFTQIDNLQQQISNLTQQRDLLLPRLMSGKININ